MKPSKRLYIFLVISVLGISFTFYGYQMVYTPNVLVGKQPSILVIPDTASFKTVQRLLYEGNYVQDLVSFSFVAKLMDYDKKVKPGRYLLKSNMSNIQAIRLLRSGEQTPINITFNNARTVDELAGKISKKLQFDSVTFREELFRFADSNSYGFNRETVIGMFIPNTYEVFQNISANGLIDRMYSEYQAFWNADRQTKANELGLTPIEVSTLASIVQAESVSSVEAPVIAGLYINRLKVGMPLQADPTLKFAVGDFTIKRVLNVHKEVESPYNTYKYAGLPPGPINMPEIKSIDAVLNYDRNDYLYMCAKEDFSGNHNFTNSLREHAINAKKWQTALSREEQIGRQRRQN